MKQLLIIGGGVIGLCTAYFCMKKGFQVTVLERGNPTHDACSLGNAGMIVPSHFVPLAAPGMIAYGMKQMLNPESPFFVRPRFNLSLLDWGFKFWRAANAEHVRRASPLLRDLSLGSRALYEEFATLWNNDFKLVKKGLLMLCKEEKTLHEEAELAEKANRLGLKAEVLNAKQTAQKDPAVTMDVAGSIYFEQDCHLSPVKFVASLTRSLEENGVDFFWETEATGWKTAEGKIEAVQTNLGDFKADEFVLAGGSWSPSVVKQLGLSLPMQAGKGYSMTLQQPKQLPELCSIFTEARVAVTPMGDTLRFGGTMEITGLNESISQRRVDGIIKSVPKYFPEFKSDDFKGKPVWVGLRPCSPDGLPYVGRFAKFANLSCATGHSMMGLSLGPITGKLMSQILAGESPEIASQALSPNRYA